MDISSNGIGEKELAKCSFFFLKEIDALLALLTRISQSFSFCLIGKIESFLRKHRNFRWVLFPHSFILPLIISFLNLILQFTVVLTIISGICFS